MLSKYILFSILMDSSILAVSRKIEDQTVECAEVSVKNKLAQQDTSHQNCLRTDLYRLAYHY